MGHSFTIVQTFKLTGVTVAEMSVLTQINRVTADISESYLDFSFE